MDPYQDDGCVTFLVRHAWLSMRSALAEALEEHGLSVQQYGTLLCVRKDPGLTIADVGRVVGTTRQSANELITGMEGAGLVERRPNPKDRRTQQVHLTPAGARKLDEATPAIRKVENELEAAFTAADRTTARAWLSHMIETIEG
ncbi:MarR family transcriptional regulator [Kribbella sp. NPDC026611]|uniref:MarR family winged helix-turn-helix transcriptional regulator n=1 Tax=Kribbella sp. NPDC026611 TaxID=3154911 RepID=UPI0033C7A79D